MFSLFYDQSKPTIKLLHPFKKGDLNYILDLMRSSINFEHQTRMAREEYQNYLLEPSDKNKERFDYAKFSLPGITFNGTFKSRNNKSLIEPSYFICLDFDNVIENPKTELDKIEEIKKNIGKNEHVALIFISPSGTGLKVLIKLTKPDREVNMASFYKQAYSSLEVYFKENYSLEADPACKDLSRLTLLCADLNLFYRENPVPYSFQFENKKEATTSSFAPQKRQDFQLNTLVIDDILAYLKDNNLSITRSYSNWITVGYALMTGFNQEDAWYYFEELSKLDETYDTVECEKQFAALTSSFNPELISFKYVVNEARKLGYELPKEIKKQDDYKYSHIDLPELLKAGKHQVYLNEITKEYYFKKDGKYKLIDNPSTNSILNSIRKDFIENLTLNRFEEYLYEESNIVSFNPLSELFQSIKTSDDSELGRFFEVINSTNDGLTRKFINKWLIGTFTNLFSDTFFKNILVFKGGQDLGKTTMVNKLCGLFDRYINNNFNWTGAASGNKDQLSKLARYAIIFDDELSSTDKASIDAIKNITSYDKVRYRVPYDVQESEFKRIASFIGCSNNNEIFNDLTGNSRFYICDLTNINWEELNKIDFKKVWGYSYHQYLSGVDIKIDKSEFNAHVEQFRAVTDEEMLLSSYIEADSTKMYSKLEIVKHIESQTEKQFVCYNKKFGAIMEKIGIQKKNTVKDKLKGVYYFCNLIYASSEKKSFF